jgi:hypothetical protein
MVQNRIFWAVQAVGIKPNGNTGGYTEVHGLQTVGLTTTGNLEQVFEQSQIEIYENIEDIPDVEMTLDKVLDGYPLIYHLATQGAPSAGISGRQAQQSIVALAVFADTSDSASGVPLTCVETSGMYVSSLTYTFPVDGNFTEAVTLVGNNKVTSAGGSSSYGTAFTGSIFDNTDVPMSLADSGGVGRRENLVYGGVANITVLPTQIPGISSSGTNELSGNDYPCHVQNITVTADFGRDSINELGRKGPYARFVNFPVEVTTDIEIMALSGDMIDVTEVGTQGDGNNFINETIKVASEEGTFIDVGTKNKISNISYGGADTGGGNATITYSYSGFNTLVITHPEDPSIP